MAKSPRPKKFRQSKSRVKTMLLTFFDIRGIQMSLPTRCSN